MFKNSTSVKKSQHFQRVSKWGMGTSQGLWIWLKDTWVKKWPRIQLGVKYGERKDGPWILHYMYLFAAAYHEGNAGDENNGYVVFK